MSLLSYPTTVGSLMMEADFEPGLGASTLLWFRHDLPRDAVRAYWAGPHAQFVARQKSLYDYRQHHFDEASSLTWPTVDGLETVIPAARRIDGMPECMVNGLLGGLRGGKEKKLVFADEANIFRRTVLYITGPSATRRYRLKERGRVASRAVVILRRNADVRPRSFASFVNNYLAPSLIGDKRVRELNTQNFLPWRNMWDTPGVSHDNPEPEQFHAVCVLGFASDEERAAFFSDGSLNGLSSELAAHCSAAHVYSVAATYHYVVNGRVMLPQTGPVARPSINPARRSLPPPPSDADFIGLSDPISNGKLLPLSASSPEDVVIDHNGMLVTAVGNGSILRVDPLTGVEEQIGHTGGRPLGLEVLPDGRIVICDAHKGLLRLDPATSEITTLVSHVDDVPLRFCSNVTATSDGSLWFTESTTRFDFEDFPGAFLEQRASGRLIRRDPAGRCDVIFDDLLFANGITVTDDETALIFAETADYSLSKLWLKGPRMGKRDKLVENMPGFPDNISRCTNGRFWVAVTEPRIRLLDTLTPMSALLRKFIWWATPRQQKGNVVETWALEYDTNGKLLNNVRARRPDFGGVTGVVAFGEKLACVSTQFSSILLTVTVPTEHALTM